MVFRVVCGYTFDPVGSCIDETMGRKSVSWPHQRCRKTRAVGNHLLDGLPWIQSIWIDVSFRTSLCVWDANGTIGITCHSQVIAKLRRVVPRFDHLLLSHPRSCHFLLFRFHSLSHQNDPSLKLSLRFCGVTHGDPQL